MRRWTQWSRSKSVCKWTLGLCVDGDTRIFKCQLTKGFEQKERIFSMNYYCFRGVIEKAELMSDYHLIPLIQQLLLLFILLKVLLLLVLLLLTLVTISLYLNLLHFHTPHRPIFPDSKALVSAEFSSLSPARGLPHQFRRNRLLTNKCLSL